jgi:hypothetical protein
LQPIPDKASFFVCYRWKTKSDDTQFDQTRPDQVERNNDGTTWTVTTTIPRQLQAPPPKAVPESAFPLVPLADVRIIAFKEDKTVAADASTVIGVTHPFVAFFWATFTIIVMLIALCFIACKRLKHPGIKKANWFLQIISTPSGYASLSQLQIVLWTLVVAACAVYVMALSGELIEITDGTLVLLGIAGAAALGAAAHTASQSSAAAAAADAAQHDADNAKIDAAEKGAAAAGAANAAAVAAKNIADTAAMKTQKAAETATNRAAAFKEPPQTQVPKWSDLIISESTAISGAVSREIDVTRFQMLLFTLITAAFVLLNVLTTYVIPEIPTGFLTLMGISNGVYLGAKVVQGS